MAFSLFLTSFLLLFSDFPRLKTLFGATISCTWRTDSKKISSSSSRISCSVNWPCSNKFLDDNLDASVEDDDDVDEFIEDDDDVDESLGGDVDDLDLVSDKRNTSSER